MPSTLINNEPATRATPAQNRKVRTIHQDSFGTSDRGDEWGWSTQATWWHQKRGVKGFHKRILYGFCAKAEFPTSPTVENVVDAQNDQTKHTWEVSAS